jgi:hypothetical protein
MESSPKNQQLPTGLPKETELPKDTDYRGIAGSGSINASNLSDNNTAEGKRTPSDPKDDDSPLAREI